MQNAGRIGFRIFLALLLAGCLFHALAQAAENPSDLFKQGNADYAAGKYEEAIRAYEGAKQAGLQHWILEYNLGDAYYRAGHLGKAVVSFERAFRMNSGSGDLIDNLDLVSTRAGDPRKPVSALPALFWRLFYLLNLNTLTLLAFLLFAALSVALAGGWLGRWRLAGAWLGVSGAVLGVLVLWLSTRVYWVERPTAVVVAATAEVRSGPNLSYPANFTIPEGRRVLILEEQEPVAGWMEIGVPQEGLKGWVPDSAIERV